MDGENPVTTPAQAAHENELQQHRNGAINLAQQIPETPPAKPFMVRAPEWGPGMWKSSATPEMTLEERQQAEPWNYATPAAEASAAHIASTDSKTAKKAAIASRRAETELSIAEAPARDDGHSR
jgi:hypothetical protein